MNVYSSTWNRFYVDRMDKDLIFNSYNRGSVKTIFAKINSDLDFERENRNGRLNVIAYEVRKNEVKFILNKYWTKRLK